MKSLSLEDEDLIEESDVLITLSNKGYIKRLDQGEFTAQNVVVVVFKEQVLRMTILFVSWCQLAPMITYSSSQIKAVYRLKGYEIPEYGRTAKGLPIVNLLKLMKAKVFKPSSMLSLNAVMMLISSSQPVMVL